MQNNKKTKHIKKKQIHAHRKAYQNKDKFSKNCNIYILCRACI